MEITRAPKIVGYARVSTDDQTTDMQLDALRRAGCTEIVHEVGVSGTIAAADRPVLGKLLRELLPGDKLVVWKLDRFGRSLIDLITTIPDLVENKKVAFESIHERIDTSHPIGKMMFQMLAVLAEFERNQTAHRTRAGLQATRERGTTLGRPRVATPELAKAVETLVGAKLATPTELRGLAVAHGVSFRTVQRVATMVRRQRRYQLSRDAK